MSDIAELQERLRQFTAERDWDQFHTPKNLAMALAGEAGELLAEFQWLTPEQSQLVMDEVPKAQAVEDELADVMIYLARLADVLDVDLITIAHGKVERNEERFPPLSGRGGMLTEAQLRDVWRRIWESASDDVDDRGRRRHTAGIKWLLTDYGVEVRSGAGPHGPIRQDVLARLESMGAVERIGGGREARTRALWVVPPPS